MVRRPWVSLPALVVFLLLASPGFADIIHLKSGGKIEGIILSDSDGKLRVKTKAGVVTIPRGDVRRIEEKLTPLDEYETRLGALDPEDAEGYFRLALFCKETGLRMQEREIYRRVLEIDDQHDAANEAVGNVRHEDRWMTPEERDRRLFEAAAAEKRAQGLVEHEGGWVTPEEKANLEKGLVRHEGKWMTPDEVKQARGYVKYKGGWIKREELEKRTLTDTYGQMMGIDVKVALSEHFAAVGPFDEAELASLCEAGEQAYDQFCEIMGVDPPENIVAGREENAGRKRCHIVYSKKQFDYGRLVDGMQKMYPTDIPLARARLMKGQKGFYFVYPACYVMGHQHPNTFQQVRGAVLHKTSHVLLMRYRYASGFFPWWLIEGLGTYQEMSLLGSCDTFCITEKGYGAPEGDPKRKWPGMVRWKEVVKRQVAARSDRGLIRLSELGLNQLDFRDLTKCWSLVEWLLGHDREGFVKMVDLLKLKVPLAEATQKAFGRPPEQLDREWRDHVRANY